MSIGKYWRSFAGFAALGLDLDASKNEQIFDQLLELDPEEVIAKVSPFEVV